jgi:hypothetical protein
MPYKLNSAIGAGCPRAKVPGGGRSQKSDVPVFRGAPGLKCWICSFRSVRRQSSVKFRGRQAARNARTWSRRRFGRCAAMAGVASGAPVTELGARKC